MLGPPYPALVGIQWIDEHVLKVNKHSFARLFGIKTIDGSLFHQQGNFPSHGFREINPLDVSNLFDHDLIADVDGENVRLLTHSAGIFTRSSRESDLVECKWSSYKKRNNDIS